MITRRDFLKLSILPSWFGRKLPPLQVTSASIQEMIDTAAANGERLVRVPPGEYTITQTIECAMFVGLDLTGVVLRLGADVDVIHAAQYAPITGGWIDCSLVPFTHAGILFDGSEHHFDVAFPTWISNVQFLGPWEGERTGTAIKLQAEDGYVFGATFNNIGVAYFDKGIHLFASNGQRGGWVNANQFSNISMQACVEFVRLDGANGNNFSNVQMQPDASAMRALVCDSQYNLFSNFFVWDWPINTTAIELTNPGGYNVIVTELLYQWYGTIDDQGAHNRIINSL